MNNYYNNDYRSYGGGGYNNHRINEEDVPESKHALFIRGLPGNMTTDEVKEFFETKIGQCSFDFTKVSQDRSRLFVAVRFENREHAKECMMRYKDNDILGYPCELTWFRDIRRFASYQAAQQGGRSGAALRGRTRGNFQRNNFPAQRGYDRGRQDSAGRKRRRSRSDSRDTSRSRSPPPRSRSRTGSRSSRGSRSKTRSSSRDSRESRKRDETPSPNREESPDSKRRLKKEKKQKRKKEKRTKRSRSHYSSASDGELRSDEEREQKDRDVSRTSHRSHSRSDSVASKPIVVQRDGSESPALPIREVKQTDDKDIKISITLPSVNPAASVLKNTSFTLGLDGDESPKRVVRRLSTGAISPADDFKGGPMLPPPPAPPTIEVKAKDNEAQFRRGRFKPIEDPVETVERPSAPAPSRRSPSPAPKRHRDPSPSPIRREEPPLPPPPPAPLVSTPKQAYRETPQNTPKMREQKYPLSAKLLNGLKEYQSNIVASIRYEPPEEEDGGLRLSSLSTMETEESDAEEKAVLREKTLASLSEVKYERVELKKKQLEKQFKNDCETYKIVIMKLLGKDGDLEKPIRLAMMQVIEDLEKQMLEKLDAFMETL